ncbi:hypothetical protein [Wolbachia endosymbiont (group A) of Epistrophe grossularia]|uniref:hypothetical protein n=1 Tax=Wolbachia endosymbiont (group A) of Epistrophe grossularia TaxID=2954008 RepID=UPI00222E919A|nr:hypothetical protein [Wolbachia endosymbiont (group A) of Epistrophe grossularia]
MHNNGENIGLVRSLLDGEYQKFEERFESFLDQCPSFLHSVGKDRFFPAFFFGMFATAFDSDIAKDSERIFFRFDNDPDNPRKGNLKVAILTEDRNGRQIVRCYTIADRTNSIGSRFSEEEKQWVERKLQGDGTKRRKLELEWEEYKIFVWAENLGEDEKEEAIRCKQFSEDEAFTQDSASLCDGFEEVVRTMQQGNLSNLLGRLASNNADYVFATIRNVFNYIIDIYNRYNHVLDFNGKESDYHGFLSGFLMNFRYRHTAGIYLELFVGGGYTDITFLIRGVDRLRDSVPIIIELKAGGESADQALEQAENYVIRCPVSSISIHTSSGSAVCVGLNFDLDEDQRLRLSTQDFLDKGSSLLERLFNGSVDEIRENVRNYLLYPSFGVPAVPDVRGTNSRVFSYTTGFAFASTAFAKKRIMVAGGNWVDVTKYLFNYHDNDKMLGPQGRVAQVNVRDRALTMVLRALWQGEERIIVLDVRHALAHQFPIQGLDLSRWPDARVYEVACTLNPRRRDEDDLGLAVDVTPFQSPADYLQSKGNQSFQGELLTIGGVSNIHSTANVMMNTGWQDINRHKALFQAISKVLFTLKWVVNRNNAREVGFHSVLHGLFYTCDNPARIIIEFQLGGGEKIDLVLLRSAESRGGVHPIAKELKFADDYELQSKIQEANNQLNSYLQCRGYKRITDGDTVVLSYAIWNDRAQRPDTLISVKDVLRIKDNLGHSSADDLPGR